VALYQFTTYVATFIAPILGTSLADALGYAPALFVGSGLRFAGAALFILLGVGATLSAMRKPAELPAPIEHKAPR
jgi:hypothetical protein